MEKTYNYTFTNNFNELRNLKSFINEIGNQHKISNNLILRIQLSLEELVVNIISYAYEDSKSHEIKLKVCVAENNLTFCLTDDGKPFNPLKFKPKKTNTDLKNRTPGGVGIILAKEFMDTVSYKYQEGFNQLTLNKKLS